MKKRYDLRKIYTLLVQGFNEDQLRDFCQHVPEFNPICDQLTLYSSKDDIIRQIFEHARQTGQFDPLLAWTQEQNPEKYKALQPFCEDSDPAGEYLGKYRVIKRLKRGGTADVYRAYHTGLNRQVVIKALHSHLAGEKGFAERFRQEASAVTGLRHPHIAQVHDFFTVDDTCYIVMDFIDGRTLEEDLYRCKINEQPFDLDETIRIFDVLTGAIDYAHNRDIIHRDLKPANIMFTPDREIILTDFGIARIMGAIRYTMTGAVFGTPAYMSPEQAQGQPVDARSDIYALGAILFEMVTGHILFEGDTSVVVLLKHVTEPPPQPTDLNPNLSQAVENVILKALRKNPDNRFQTAGKMSRALAEAAALAAGESKPDTNPLSPAQARKPPPKTTPLQHRNID